MLEKEIYKSITIYKYIKEIWKKCSEWLGKMEVKITSEKFSWTR